MKAFREYLVDKHETSRAGSQDLCLGKFPTAEITDLIITALGTSAASNYKFVTADET